MIQYTLSELCDVIQDTVITQLNEQYWVKAEIASLSIRGHCYLELVEKADNGTIAAKMRATCWSHRFNMLNPYFTQETGQNLQVGMQVLLLTTTEFHPVYGLSLNIHDIDPTYTLGDLARQRQLTLQRLQEDGVLELQQSLTIPTLPRYIAIISSPDAAGYTDFCHQLTHNNLHFSFKTQLFPATMQGENAADSIIRALLSIAQQAQQWDVVVIIRGGGATTDLGCFDDYMLASHCAQFPVPIITGIGHTRDISIVDRVAHTALKTPTAAAQFLISLIEEQTEYIQQLQNRLYNAFRNTLTNETNRLQHYQQSLHFSAKHLITNHRNKLSLYLKTIEMHSPERIYNMGYSLLMTDGHIIRSAREVQKGQHIQTHLQDGIIESIVTEQTTRQNP